MKTTAKERLPRAVAPSVGGVPGVGGERGSLSLEYAILAPIVVVTLMVLGVQLAEYQHARTVAIAAAQEGARAAGAQDGQESDGVRAAAAFIKQSGGQNVLQDATETAHRTATTATVVVHGSSLTLIRGWHLHITQSATVPVERLTAP